MLSDNSVAEIYKNVPLSKILKLSWRLHWGLKNLPQMSGNFSGRRTGAMRVDVGSIPYRFSASWMSYVRERRPHKLFSLPGICSALNLILCLRRTKISGCKMAINSVILDVCLFSTQTTALLSQWKHTCELVSLWANVVTNRKIGYNSSTTMSYVFHEGGHWPWVQCVPYVPPNPQSEASVYICMLLDWTSGEKCMNGFPL